MADNHLTDILGKEGAPLVVVISPSPVYRETLLTYLIDFEYAVGGPFESLDPASHFIKDHSPDLVIYDAITTQTELIAMSNLLREKLEDTPVIVLHERDSFSLNHSKIEFIYPPINPFVLESKLDALLHPQEDDAMDEIGNLVDFINALLFKMRDLAPQAGKIDIDQILVGYLAEFADHFAGLSVVSSSRKILEIRNRELVDIDALVAQLAEVLPRVVQEIDSKMESTWGKSLLEDTIEAVTLDFGKLSPAAISIVDRFGKGYLPILKKFKYAVPELQDLDTNVVVAKLLLTDYGPELQDVVATNDKLRDDFDDGIASQLLTLVGQGSQYHEGIFGPVPIPRTSDLVAIIWSRLIGSDIEDERMGGKTLIIITIGFKQEILNHIPSNEHLQQIFRSIASKSHEREVDEFSLETIAEQFRGMIK